MTNRTFCPLLNGLFSVIPLVFGMSGIADAQAQAQAATSMSSGTDSAVDKDRIIADLLRRVETLERRLADTPRTAPATTQASSQGQKIVPAPAKASGASSGMPLSTAANPAASSANEPADEETSRALERTLIREGGLVLPVHAYEIEPRLTYEYRSSNALQIVNIGGQPQVSRQDMKRDAFEASVGIRAGLRWATQLDIQLPYARNRERRVVLGVSDQTDRASGFGNLEIGITKQLLNESKGVPGMLGTLRWHGAGATDDFGNPAAVGSSFRSLQAALTLVKRQDPVVFFGGLSHEVIYPKTINAASINPGNATGMRLGSILALSPDTSMRLGFQFSRSAETIVNGAKIAGSSATVGLLDAGFSIVLSPKMLLGVEAGFGLTPSSPDFRLGISLPVRF
jgi:hypothetical protein